MSTRIITPPGRATGTLRLPLAFIALLGVAACSDAQSPQPGFDPTAAFAPPSGEAVTHVNCTATAGTLAGNKSVLVAVNDANGDAVEGAIVTALSPQYGPLCWGETSVHGNISLNNLKKDAAILLSVRDELASDAVRLEIVPPDPLTSLMLDDLTPPGATRHQPTLVGGTACTDSRPLTWPAYSTLRNTPCIIPGSNLDVTVSLPVTTAVTATIYDPNGDPASDVIVGAVSPALTWFPAAPTLQQLTDECAKVPFRLASECVGNSHGPAMLQAMDLTDADGQVHLGVAQGTGNPIVFEAIGDLNGQTLFGTVIGGGTTLLSPGMCYVTEVPDSSEPWSVPDVDILSTAHSVGMVAVDNDPLTPGPELDPVPTTLVVKIHVKANGDGGAGSFTMNYRKAAVDGNLTVRSSFAIPAPGPDATCSAAPGTGSGMAGATLVPQCTQVPGSTNEFIVFYSLILPSGTTVAEALYDVSTDGDHTDPERSATYYMRGSIMFEHLTPAACSLEFNNDARWTSA